MRGNEEKRGKEREEHIAGESEKVRERECVGVLVRERETYRGSDRESVCACLCLCVRERYTESEII